MKLSTVTARVAAMLCAMWMTSGASHAADATQDDLKRAVDAAIQPLMTKDKIPGMAVGVIVDGRAMVFNYGVVSTETGKPVTDATLFELGSVSKTFTATLTSWAQVDKQLSLTDRVAKYLPTLR